MWKEKSTCSHQTSKLFAKAYYTDTSKTNKTITRCTRGARVVFSVTRMRSSNSARINKFDFRTEKSCSVHMSVRNCCWSQCCQLDAIIDMMYVVDQSKQCSLIYLQKIACCLKLQLLILFFVKSIISDMHHRITYMYINFQQNWVCRSVKPCTQSYLHNIASCIDLQLPIVIWKKIIILDMHHHKTYMCINF